METMRNIKLLIAYDGTDFCGWQNQHSAMHESAADKAVKSKIIHKNRTVQGVIEDVLLKIHKEHIPLIGSGRTDTGVHAAGQIANFHTNMQSIPAERFAPALNSLLPRDVRILASNEVCADFHSRYDASMRTYRYFFIPERLMFPHESSYNIYLRRWPDLKLLNAYCRFIMGERDCTVFASAGDTSLSFNRYISNAVFFIEKDRLIFEICENAFLRKMVRCIAGTFLRYEELKTPPDLLQEILAKKDRSLVGPILDPQGLFLWKVDLAREC